MVRTASSATDGTKSHLSILEVASGPLCKLFVGMGQGCSDIKGIKPIGTQKKASVEESFTRNGILHLEGVVDKMAY